MYSSLHTERTQNLNLVVLLVAQILFLKLIYIVYVHRCGVCGSMRACDVVDPYSIPGRDKFSG